MDQLKNKNTRPPSKSGGAIISILLGVSLLANVWLARALLHPAAEAATAGLSGNVTKSAEKSSAPTPALAVGDFHWRMVESSDYRRYLENLEIIGCPAETATNLITGLMLDDYSAAFWEAARSLRVNFWKFRMNPDEPEAVLARNAIKTLEAETTAVWKRTFPDRQVEFGLGRAMDSRSYSYGLPEFGNSDREAVLGFLSPEKQKAVRSIVSVDERKQTQMLFFPPNGMREKYPPWYWQNDNAGSIQGALFEVLTPVEEEEFEVRHSSVAARIRESLYGFAASPSELRTIAKVMLDADKASGFLGYDIEKHHALENERLKSYLGAERFAEFKRGLEPGFRNFALLEECYATPAGTATEMFELAHQTVAIARELLADRKATDREKRSSVNDLRETLRRKMTSLFGPRALETYELNGGFALPTLEPK